MQLGLIQVQCESCKSGRGDGQGFAPELYPTPITLSHGYGYLPVNTGHQIPYLHWKQCYPYLLILMIFLFKNQVQCPGDRWVSLSCSIHRTSLSHQEPRITVFPISLLTDKETRDHLYLMAVVIRCSVSLVRLSEGDGCVCELFNTSNQSLRTRTYDHSLFFLSF